MNVIQLFAGAIGCVGFGLIYNLRLRYLPLAAGGGFLCWFIYLLSSEYLFSGIFLPTLASGFVTAMYAEVLARICRAPSTPFFITSVLPLVPGSTLYYCIDALVQNETARAQSYGIQTFLYALAIAGGMAIAWTICDFSRKVQAAVQKRRTGHTERP
jgi:uncharacterized membrane protein YjjB (DUF3815 family)